MFTCVHVLEGQVMKGIILGKGLMLKFFAPKVFKTWKDLESQVLNSAIIVKTSGHGVAKRCRSSRLGFRPVAAKS